MNYEIRQCLACGEGKLSAVAGSQVISYKGHSRSVPFHYSVCDCCGSELINAEEARENKRAATAFKREVDGLPSGNRVRTIRASLGLGQSEAAVVFGGGKVAFSKYENDDVTPSEAMAKLLELAYEVPEAREWLFKKAGICREVPSLPDVAVVYGGVHSCDLLRLKGYRTVVEHVDIAMVGEARSALHMALSGADFSWFKTSLGTMVSASAEPARFSDLQLEEGFVPVDIKRGRIIVQ